VQHFFRFSEASTMAYSKRIKTPVNQKRFTNVVVVRHKTTGKRFEIACYPNKVEEWRRKVETDINEVVQSTNIYVNVQQGKVAHADALEEAYDTTDKDKIVRIILEKGEIQISKQERQEETETLFKDVATFIVEKCVHAETKQALTLGVVERAMREVGVSLNPNKPAKQQALKVIHLLQEKSSLPIERAKMQLQFSVPKEKSEDLKKALAACITEIQSESTEGTNSVIVILMEPLHFREVDQAIKTAGGRTDVLQHVVKPQTDSTLDQWRFEPLPGF